MSYNGIGLQTARGSGTNGYVTSNQSAVRGVKLGHFERRKEYERRAETTSKKFSQTNISDRFIDHGLLEHEQKRRIEVAVLELQDELERSGVSSTEIDLRTRELRERLVEQKTKLPPARARPAPHDVHAQAELKSKENKRFQQAIWEVPIGRHRTHRHRERSLSPSRGAHSRHERAHTRSRDNFSKEPYRQTYKPRLESDDDRDQSRFRSRRPYKNPSTDEEDSRGRSMTKVPARRNSASDWDSRER